MGEIKSTLDLVMERTRHLSMTEEEKATQKKNEVKKNIKGVIQKYLDSLMSIEKTGEAIDALQNSTGFDIKDLVIADIAGRIELTRDNQLLFDLLESFKINTSDLASLISGYKKEIMVSNQTHTRIRRKELAERYGISGAAVFPNPGVNPQWKKEIQDIYVRWNDMLSQQKASL